jgi:hypothetical protein
LSTFATPRNGVSTTLGASYTAGSGSLVLDAGAGASFGAPTPDAPIRVTVVTDATYGTASETLTIFRATGRTSDTLTGVTAVEGTTDRNYSSGDRAEMRVTAAAVSDLNTAVLALEAADTALDSRLDAIESTGLSWLSLKDEGIADDAVLTNGSATFGTNETTDLQAILDLASGGPIGIRWDVRCSHTGLNVRSNTLIQALPGCGSILRTNSDRPILRNQNWNPAGYGTPDKHITIRGGTWNGNGGTIASHNQAHDHATYGWVTGLSFMGVEDILIEDAQIINARTFGLHVAGFKRARFHRCWIDDGIVGVEANHDGFHVNGPGQDGEIVNCGASCRDDHFSICANDGDDVGGVPFPNVGGPIERFVVSDFHIDGGGAGFRVLSRDDPITGLSIRGVRGDCIGYVGILDNFDDEAGSEGEGAFRSVTIEDVDVIVTGAGISAMFRVGGVWDQLKFRDVKKNRHTYEMGLLLLDNSLLCQLLEFDFSVYDALGTLASAMIQADAGQVGTLAINGRVARRGAFPAVTAPALSVNGTRFDRVEVKGSYRGIKNVVDFAAGTMPTLRFDGIHVEEGTGGAVLAITSGRTLTNFERHGTFADDATGLGTITNSYGSWVAGDSDPVAATVGAQNQSEFTDAGSPAITAITPEIGAVWTVPAGTAPTVTGGAAVHSAGTAPTCVCDAFVADGVMSVQFLMDAVSAGNGFGLIFGYTNATNFNVLNIDSDSFDFFSVVGGVAGAANSYARATSTATDYDITVVRSGTSYTVTINGTTLATATVPGNLAATKHGFYFYGTALGKVKHYRFYR